MVSGHHDADIITLMQDGSARYTGSWNYRPTHNSNENTNPRCKGAWHANIESVLTWGRFHTSSVQTVHPTSVTDSLWTVRFDPDCNSTDVDDARDASDGTRMRLMHKQTLEKTQES